MTILLLLTLIESLLYVSLYSKYLTCVTSFDLCHNPMRWVLLLSPFQRCGKLRPREVKCLTQRQGQSGCASSQAVCSLDFLLCSFQCFLAPAPPKVPSNNLAVWLLTAPQPGYEVVSSRSWRAFNPRPTPPPHAHLSKGFSTSSFVHFLPALFSAVLRVESVRLLSFCRGLTSLSCSLEPPKRSPFSIL